mmetsp:Transcript_2966/g.5649  ORF Transcript_2966/g.5649 Transcript_2966/m.5649 type:complete len:322 (-) Transcript_2966:2535-3500(-)
MRMNSRGKTDWQNSVWDIPRALFKAPTLHDIAEWIAPDDSSNSQPVEEVVQPKPMAPTTETRPHASIQPTAPNVFTVDRLVAPELPRKPSITLPDMALSERNANGELPSEGRDRNGYQDPVAKAVKSSSVLAFPDHRRAISNVEKTAQDTLSLSSTSSSHPRSRSQSPGMTGIEADNNSNASSSKPEPSRRGWFPQVGVFKNLQEKLVTKITPSKQAHMGEQLDMYYNKDLGRWVIPGEEDKVVEAIPPPPPTGNGKTLGVAQVENKDEGPLQQNPIARPTGPKLAARSRYVDTLTNPTKSSTISAALPPLAPIPKAQKIP